MNCWKLMELCFNNNDLISLSFYCTIFILVQYEEKKVCDSIMLYSELYFFSQFKSRALSLLSYANLRVPQWNVASFPSRRHLMFVLFPKAACSIPMSIILNPFGAKASELDSISSKGLFRPLALIIFLSEITLI